MLLTKLYRKFDKENDYELSENKKRIFLCAVYLSWLLLFPELLEEWKLCTVSVLENGTWVEATMDQIDEDTVMEVEYKLGFAEWIGGETEWSNGVIE